MVLPKSLRLRGNKRFDYLRKQGRRFYGKSMTLRVVNSKLTLRDQNEYSLNSKHLKCAVSISNKVSKRSVMRNKVRRRFHEHLRKQFSQKTFSNQIWALISLKPISAGESLESLLNECDHLLIKAGLLK
tara:strand:- start:306 stop:692 length:387 start_codon:yes stop_codon:yes gene_type:complete